MKPYSKLFVAAATAVILSAPVFAHDHDHGKGEEHGTCPHLEGTQMAVDQAIALLDQAKTQTGDQAKATLEQARQQLAEAQIHMTACGEMCKMMMSGDHAQATEAQPERVADPVCGMEIDTKTAEAKSVYAGKTYYFCSKEDKAKFDSDPEKYLKKQG
ncbi:MAG TPA: YHS domain-containing protein [Thermoanaerobaculia bacterium]|nr:YHS domain-containing protein [Thermoanaerobaculia bacterium]